MDVPDPSSSSVRGAGAAGDVRGLALEDLGLSPGRVVLVEPGDVVEELGAPLVVEPLRRQVLRRGGEAVAGVAPERLGQVGSVRWTSIVQRSAMSVGVMRVLRATRGGRRRGPRRLPDDRVFGHLGPTFVVVERLGGDEDAAGGQAASPRVNSELPHVGGHDHVAVAEQQVEPSLGARTGRVGDDPRQRVLWRGAARRGRRARGRRAPRSRSCPRCRWPAPRTPAGAGPRRSDRGTRSRSRSARRATGPSANGALPVSTIGDGGVALRTAAVNGTGVDDLGHRAERAVGPHRRRRAVAGGLGAHGGVPPADAPAIGVHGALALAQRLLALPLERLGRLVEQRRQRAGRAEVGEVAAHQTSSRAVRKPAKICRRMGRSQLRNVVRHDARVGGPGPAAQHLVAVAVEHLGVLLVGERHEAG